jgi:uncharacterized membrane protein
MSTTRKLVVACFIGLIFLGLAWELWLAPLRPHGSLWALKVLPLCAALPSLLRGSVRSMQGWSMGILAYVTEGLVRATSDRGLSMQLAWIESVLAIVAFCAILLHIRAVRAAGVTSAAASSSKPGS